ncbi:MAG: nucleotide pyrophosphohydrolase [Patescibacteria group bacterium]|nr:nucleotide pyrophosphohydrolase [Patescibacteria group bacterium]
MNIKDFQNEVDKWTAQFDSQYWKPHEILARLVEEVGELSREINHLYGPKRKKATEEKRRLSEEIADVIFTLICLANSKGIDLEDSLQKVIDKSYKRDNDRYRKK